MHYLNKIDKFFHIFRDKLRDFLDSYKRSATWQTWLEFTVEDGKQLSNWRNVWKTLQKKIKLRSIFRKL